MSFQFSGGGGGGGQPPPSPPDIMDMIVPQNNSYPSNPERKVVLEPRTSSDSPQKKLSMAELQRMKINAASDYYRKLREGGGGESSPKNLGPPPPLIPTTSAQQKMAAAAAAAASTSVATTNLTYVQTTVVNNVEGYAHLSLENNVQTRPNLQPQLVAAAAAAEAKPNIDLGAIVRSTIINGVTKTFTQHWIVVGGSIRVLLLDFDGSFTLLIPGVEPLKAFSNNTVNVEVQKKGINNGQQQLTFMKFSFPSPPMEISAPVLVDKQMGFQVLKQNSACVFLGRILDLVKKPANTTSSLSQLLEQQQKQEELQQQPSAPPQLPQGTVIVPAKAAEEPVKEPEKSSELPKKLVFVDDLNDNLYVALKPKELDKIVQCRYCPRKFKFLSEHLSHLKKHTQDVDSVVEMSIKIWVPDRKLKCDACKFKTSYTLDYAKHKDTHVIEGLACSICQCEVNTPQAYGEHMEIHHPSRVFSCPEESHQTNQSRNNVSGIPEVVPGQAPFQSESLVPQEPSNEDIAQTFQPVHQVPQVQTLPEVNQLVQPPQPVQQIEPVQPVQQFEPVQPVQHIEPVQPVQHIEPVQPVQQIEPVQPFLPVQPVQPVEPPVQPIQSSQNTSLVQPPESLSMKEPIVQQFQDQSVQDQYQYPNYPDHSSFSGTNHTPQIMSRSSSMQSSPQVQSPQVQNSPFQQPSPLTPPTIASNSPNFVPFSSPQIQQPFPSPHVQSPKEGPKKVLEDLLDGSPEDASVVQDMPVLDSGRQVSIRESLDSHEDELLEDLASYSEELINKENEKIDESVVSLAKDLIDKIEEQEFDDEDDDDEVPEKKEGNVANNEEEDLDFQLQLSEDEDELPADLEESIFPSVEKEAVEQIPEKEEVSDDSSEEEIVAHKCELCGSEFATPTSLKIHRLKCAKMHQQQQQMKQQQQQNVEEFSCQFCHDEFRSETSLKMHKLICSSKKKTEKNETEVIEEKQTEEIKVPPMFPIRKVDPIREFFEQEEKKKQKVVESPKKVVENNIEIAKDENVSSRKLKSVKEVMLEQEENQKKSCPTLKIKVPKKPLKEVESSNSILTQHLKSAKTLDNVVKAFENSPTKDNETFPDQPQKSPLKLKISLPPKPKENKIKKKAMLPKIPILPPKPPILGAFVTKNNGTHKSKGEEIHHKRKSEEPLQKVPKLVIKNLKKKKKLKKKPQGPPHEDLKVKPCKVSIKNLDLSFKPPEKESPEKVLPPVIMKLNIKEPVKEEIVKPPPLKTKIVIKDIPLPPPAKAELVKPLNIKLGSPPPIQEKVDEKPPPPPLKLSLKSLKQKTVPSLKIKLPPKPKPKRSLMNILNGLTKNLPIISEPMFEVPEQPLEDFHDEKDELINGETLADHLPFENALDLVIKESSDYSKKIADSILNDIIDKVVTTKEQPKKILKPITLKVHNVDQAKKPKFKVIRVSSQTNRKLKRSGSGLDLNDYKGKRRRRNKKKLDKLIIRNISSILQEQPPKPEAICSSILNKTITELPCFQAKPITLKITKDKLRSLKMKIKAPKKPQEVILAKREMNLKKQLEIDMVDGDKIFTEEVLQGKRKAKMEARKAMEKAPSPKKKAKKVEEEIDPQVAESIFEQIMGDETSTSSSSGSPKAEEEKKESSKIEEQPKMLTQTIEKLVQEEVDKELRRSVSPSLPSNKSKKKEMWVTSPVVFAKKSSAPPPKEEETTTLPLTEFHSTESNDSSNASSSPNIVKSTIKAIQLKATPEILEGGSKEVLDMIDDLFDNFFDNCQDSDDDEEEEFDIHNVVQGILNDVIAKVVKKEENGKKPVSKRPRQEAFSRNSYAKRRRKLKIHSKSTSTESEALVSKLLDELVTKITEASSSPTTIKKKRKINNNSSAFCRSAYVKRKKRKQEIPIREKKDSESSHTESSSSDEILGKGKRKRFQNVRMMPIEDIVKSPSKKK